MMRTEAEIPWVGGTEIEQTLDDRWILSTCRGATGSEDEREKEEEKEKSHDTHAVLATTPEKSGHRFTRRLWWWK